MESQGFYKHMSIMDNVKYCLGIYELNQTKLIPSEILMYGKPMEKAIDLYNKGFRRSDFQKLSILL